MTAVSEFGGRHVLVTGASSGIGAALARTLAARGDTVALVARRTSRLQDVLQDCIATSPGSAYWAADLSEPEAAAHLALQIWDHYGGIDVLVNNAAVPMRRHVTRLTMEEVERTMRINYFSPVAMSLAVLYRSDARFESAFWQIRSSSLGIVSSVCRGGRGSVVVICSITSTTESPRNGLLPVNNS